MPRTCMNIIRGDVEIEVDIDYIKPEPRTWDCPGSDGVVDIGDAVELTDEEVAYIKRHFFAYLADRTGAERAHDEAQAQYESALFAVASGGE